MNYEPYVPISRRTIFLAKFQGHANMINDNLYSMNAYIEQKIFLGAENATDAFEIKVDKARKVIKQVDTSGPPLD